MISQIEFVFQICQGLSMAFAKLSVILFCRRIFIVHDGSAMDWTTRVLIVVNVCWILGFTLTEIFGCKLKVWLHWSPLETDLINKECGDLRKPLLAYVISDFCLELMLLILPLPSVSNASPILKPCLHDYRFGDCKSHWERNFGSPGFSCLGSCLSLDL